MCSVFFSRGKTSSRCDEHRRSRRAPSDSECNRKPRLGRVSEARQRQGDGQQIRHLWISTRWMTATILEEEKRACPHRHPRSDTRGLPGREMAGTSKACMRGQVGATHEQVKVKHIAFDRCAAESTACLFRRLLSRSGLPETSFRFFEADGHGERRTSIELPVSGRRERLLMEFLPESGKRKRPRSFPSPGAAGLFCHSFSTSFR